MATETTSPPIPDRIQAQCLENIERHRKSDVTVTLKAPNGSPLAGQEVHVRQVRREFLIGCIIFQLADFFRDRVVSKFPPDNKHLFKERFLEIFNFGVLPFYWRYYEPAPGMTHWRDMLEVIEWCQANGVVTKGHPMVWACATHGLPEWLGTLSRAAADQAYRNRVTMLARGFAGMVDIWDVINEFTSGNVWENRHEPRRPQTTEETANSIEIPLRLAFEANPAATLILNNFNIINNTETRYLGDVAPRQRLMAIVRELQRRQVPFSGIGCQGHEPPDEWYSPELVWDAFDELGQTGIPIHLTELIPRSSGNPITGGWTQGAWSEQAHADYVEQMIRLAFGHPSVVSVNFWGLSDRAIWRADGGFVDTDYRPKPAFERVRQLVKEWTTPPAALQTDGQGQVALRGFHGDYELAVKGRNRMCRFSLRLSPCESATREFRVDD